MSLDHLTLSFAASLVLALSGGALILLYLGHRQERALRLAAAAFLLGAAGIALLTSHQLAPARTSLAFGNLLVIVGNALLPMAVRMFYGRRLRWHVPLLWLAAAGLIFPSAVYAGLGFTGRVALFGLFYAPLAFWTAFEFLRPNPHRAVYENWAAPRVLCGLIFLLHGIYNIVRALHPLYTDSTATVPAEPSLLHGLTMLYALVIGVVFPFGLAMIAGQKLQRRIDQLARLAPLTGALNRRAFEQRVDKELASAARHGRPTSLIILDLDHFKHINDSYGHACGDAVLEQIVGLLRERLRPDTALARLGGEEFAVLLPAAQESAAIVVMERVLAALRLATLRYGSINLQVTASAGVASAPTDGNSFATLYRKADQRLYHAKATGRDRVCGQASIPA